MSELELGTVLLQKYRIDGLRAANRDVNVYDATDTLHARHVSIKVFERACRFASEQHEGQVIDVGVVDGGAMYFVESAAPMRRTSRPPPPLPRKPIAKTKSEPPPLPIPLSKSKPPPPKPAKPRSMPPPPLPKVIIEPEIEIVAIEEQVELDDDEPTIDRNIHIVREELAIDVEIPDVEIPIDFARQVRGSSRPWWIAGIAAAAAIAGGVAWAAQRPVSNEVPTETRAIAPEVTPTQTPAIVAPPPRPATTIEPPPIAEPPPADTTERGHHHHRQPGEDPLTI